MLCLQFGIYPEGNRVALKNVIPERMILGMLGRALGEVWTILLEEDKNRMRKPN